VTDLIVVNNPDYGPRIAKAADTAFNPTSDQSIVRERDGALLGGVTVTHYTRASVQLHVAGFTDDWVSRNLIWAVFNYCFIQIGVNKIFGLVPSTNKDALSFDLKLGFLPTHRVKDVFEDADLIILEMARHQCRWLKKPKGFDDAKVRYDGRKEQLSSGSTGLFGNRSSVSVRS